MREKSEKLRLSDIILDNKPIFISERENDKTYKSRLHHHDFYELLIILKNDIRHNINGNWITLKENSIQLIRPNDSHYYKRVNSKKGLNQINIVFPTSLFFKGIDYLDININIIEKSKNLILYPMDKNLKEAILYKLEKIKDPTNNTKAQEHYFLSLLADILPPLLMQKGEENSKNIVPAWLKDTIELMREKENSIAGLKRFIELSERTQNHINKTVKKYFRISTTELINKIRFDRVNQLLVASSKSICEIMFEVGFNNSSYFNSAYKKQFGISPREYRNKITNCF